MGGRAQDSFWLRQAVSYLLQESIFIPIPNKLIKGASAFPKCGHAWPLQSGIQVGGGCCHIDHDDLW